MKLNLNQKTALIIFSLMIISGWHYGYGNILPQVLMAVFTCVIVNGVLGYFKKRGGSQGFFIFPIPL
jgi:hypothetical protein